MTKWDKYLILLIITVAMGGLFFVRSITTNNGQLYLIIEADGKEYKKISLSPTTEKQRIEIDTPFGHNVVEYDGNGARIIEADCKDQLCVKMGEITEANQINICLPNRVSVKLITNKSDLDIISY